VDEYLSEKEQVEQIKQWWRDYGWYLVGGMAVAALGYFGWNQYEASRAGRGEEASALYDELQSAIADDDTRADELLARLRNEYASSPYTDHAGLLMAKTLLISNPERAADELRRVMGTTEDRELAMIARLRLARVLAYREAYQDALNLLTVSEPGQFAARLNEIRGDVHVALGENDAARDAYLRALTAQGSESLDRRYLQMKLNALPRPPRAPTSETPAELPSEAPVEPVTEPTTDSEDGA
jgi:predicted negative regulator of RcsB-dependent stress response